MRDLKEKSSKTVPHRKRFSKRGYHYRQIASQTNLSPGKASVQAVLSYSAWVY